MIRVILFATVISVLISTLSFSQCQEWNWAHSQQGGWDKEINSVVIDTNNQFAFVGGFYKQDGWIINYDTLYNPQYNTGNAFVAKYDLINKEYVNAGYVLGSSHDKVMALRYWNSSSGYDTYLCAGHFASPTFDLCTLNGNSNYFLTFIDEYSSTFSTITVQSEGTSWQDITDIYANGSTNNVCIVGKYNGMMYLGNDTLYVPVAGEHLFIAKYNGLTYDWSITNETKSWGSDNIPKAVDVDSNGNIYVAGNLSNYLRFEDDSVETTGSTDIFIAKFDSQGNLLWLNSFGGIYPDAISDLRIKNDRIFITGAAQSDSIDIGGITVKGENYMYLYELNANGNAVWGNSFGFSCNSGWEFEPNSIDFDHDGNIVVAGKYYAQGYCSEGKIFGQDQLPLTTGSYNLFAAKFDDTGNNLWAKAIKSNNGNIEPQEITTGYRNNNIYIAGYFEGTSIEYDNLTLNYTGTPSDLLVEVNSVNSGPNIINTKDTVCIGDSILFGNNYYQSAGTYFDTLYNTSGCDSVLNVLYLEENNCNAIFEMDHSNFINVYPNPNDGNFTIKIDQSNTPKNCKIKIYSTTGSVLFNQKASKNLININLNLEPGIYLLNTEQENEKIIKKIVIY